MNNYVLAAISAACCVAGSSAASAWVVTVTEGGVVVASWAQDANPILADGDFELDNFADISVRGAVGLGGDDDIVWYDPSNDGGLSSFGGDLNIVADTAFSDPSAFTGPTSAPMFQLGTYHGIDVKPLALDNIPAIITISVPEPATWAMMLAGFGVIGVAARRRKTVSVTYA